jgi:WD40 repeat protein
VARLTGAPPTRDGPYQGLLPYGEDDAAYFFGRGAARDTVIDNLIAYRVSVLYGPSGVGKSSLLRAGVVRHVRDAGRRSVQRGVPVENVAVAFGRWSADDPAAAVAEAIADALAQVSLPLAEDLPAGSLVDVAGAAAQRLDGSLLLIFDQFEELFLYPEASGRFVEQLTQMLARRDVAASVLISIREDALARLDALTGRVPTLLDHLVRIAHLDRDAAREAINGPLELWNRKQAPDSQEVGIEPELVEAVLDGVQTGRLERGEFDGVGGAAAERDDTSIQTPYLQLVLTRLWDEERRAGSPKLRLRTFERLEGAQRILARHVDNAMAQLSPGEQELAAGVMRQLVTPSGTKIALRSTDLAEYVRATGGKLDEPRVKAVLERLTREARLLQATGDAGYEIYHDALARPILDWRRRWQDERDRARRRRRNRVVAAIVAGLVATVVVVSVLALLAVKAHDEAAERARDAESVALASASRDVASSEPDVALLLALAALARRDRPEARSSMMLAREAAGPDAALGIMRGHTAAVNDVALLRRGKVIASASPDGRIILWSAATHRRIAASFAGPPAAYSSLAVSGDVLAAGTVGGAIRLWDVATARRRPDLRAGRHEVRSLAFSLDGRTLASAGEAQPIRLWDMLARGGPRIRASMAAGLQRTFRVAFSPRGDVLASAGSDLTARLWRVRDGRPQASFWPGVDRRGRARGRFTSVAFASDGLLAVGGTQTWLWDPVGGAKRRLPSATGGQVVDLAFSPAADRLAGAGADGSVWLWDARSPRRQPARLEGPSGPLERVRFAPDGRTLVAAGDDRKVWIFVAAFPQLLRDGGERIREVAFGRGGNTIATAGIDGGPRLGGFVRLWNARTQRMLGRPIVSDKLIASVAFSADGHELAAGTETGPVLLRDLRSHRVVTLTGHRDGVSSVAFSPDGHLLASGSFDGSIILWDVRSRRRVGTVLRNDKGVGAVAFSPDGRRVATGGQDGIVRLWDVASRRTVGHTIGGRGAAVVDLAFGAHGRTLAYADFDGELRLTDLATRRTRTLGNPLAPAAGVAFDGRTLLAADEGGHVRFWDVHSRGMLGSTLVAGNQLSGIAASPDGRTFATIGGDGSARLWRHILWRDTSELAAEVCDLVGADLSAAEWARYASGIPPSSLCDA